MKYNVKFSPERRKGLDGVLNSDNVPLSADIRFAGSRLFYFTGYRLTVDWEKKNGDWNFDKDEVRKGHSVKEGVNPVFYSVANARLTEIRHELDKLFKGRPDKQAVIDRLNEVCKKKIDHDAPVELEFYPLFDAFAKELRFSNWRKKHINVTINHWKAFNKNLTFKSIDSNKLKAFESFLRYDKKGVLLRSNNTIHTLMNITRAYWNYAAKIMKEAGRSLNYPFEAYEIPGDNYGTPIGLTIEERDRIYNAQIDDKKLDKVRDVFIFQCMTGMRVGDMYKLQRSNIRDGWLHYIARKTKDEHPDTRKIKLSNKAMAILKKLN